MTVKKNASAGKSPYAHKYPSPPASPQLIAALARSLVVAGLDCPTRLREKGPSRQLLEHPRAPLPTGSSLDLFADQEGAPKS